MSPWLIAYLICLVPTYRLVLRQWIRDFGKIDGRLDPGDLFIGAILSAGLGAALAFLYPGYLIWQGAGFIVRQVSGPETDSKDVAGRIGRLLAGETKADKLKRMKAL